MKKELLLTFAAFFFMSLTALTGVYAGESDKKTVTVSEDKVDVTGDGKKDLIYVKGIPYEEGVQFLKEIYLKIKASNGKTYKIELEGGDLNKLPALVLDDKTTALPKNLNTYSRTCKYREIYIP